MKTSFKINLLFQIVIMLAATHTHSLYSLAVKAGTHNFAVHSLQWIWGLETKQEFKGFEIFKMVTKVAADINVTPYSCLYLNITLLLVYI